MITFKKVSKQYANDQSAVHEVDLHIEAGEFFVIIGPSGSGKTTTLKMINRLEDATAGEILIHRQPITSYFLDKLRWDMGYVLQQIALFPHMTIEENIAIVPNLKKWSKSKINQRIDQLMDSVGLDPLKYRKRFPHELSGGQQQRVAIVRALAGDPKILLMDEPFSALDPISRMKLQKDIRRLQQEIHKTIVFVTHDIEEAFALGDRVAIMSHGKVIQCDTPNAIKQNPANQFVADFIAKSQNFLFQYTVSDLIAGHYFQENVELTVERLPMIDRDTILYQLIDKLASDEAVKLTGTEKVYFTKQDIISFLAKVGAS